ncbi:phosphatidate cytidylyltransferase [Achromobacter aloeverae]
MNALFPYGFFPASQLPLYYAFGGVLVLLVIASVVSLSLKRARPAKNYTELRQRVRTWWWIAGIFALALCMHPKGAIVLMAVVSFLAFKEYLSLLTTRRADHVVLLWAYLAIPLQYWWVWLDWYGMFIIFIPVYLFLFLPMRMVMVGETRGFLHSAGTLHWGMMTTVFSLSHIAFLVNLPDLHGPRPLTGGMYVFYLLLLTQLNDVAQYIWGKCIGRHKVIPKVSPNKTVEGLLGGVLTTTLLAWLLAPWFTPFTPLEAVLVGLLIGLGGFIGDVVMSAVKRDIGVKDASSMLPGHGGILDRLDSLTYTAPLFFHVLYFLHY